MNKGCAYIADIDQDPGCPAEGTQAHLHDKLFSDLEIPKAMRRLTSLYDARFMICYEDLGMESIMFVSHKMDRSRPFRLG
jgi:hypothetical protein